jgi:hypothetical protein
MACRDPEPGARALAGVATVAAKAAPELLLADLSLEHAVRALGDVLCRMGGGRGVAAQDITQLRWASG